MKCVLPISKYHMCDSGYGYMETYVMHMWYWDSSKMEKIFNKCCIEEPSSGTFHLRTHKKKMMILMI